MLTVLLLPKLLQEQQQQIVQQQHGDSSKLGGQLPAYYKQTGAFAIINGTVTLTANTTANNNVGQTMQTNVDIEFPPGFNKNNCVCLAFGTRRNISPDSGKGFSYMSQEQALSLGFLTGGIPKDIIIDDGTGKIEMIFFNLATSALKLYYRIVLMRTDI